MKYLTGGLRRRLVAALGLGLLMTILFSNQLRLSFQVPWVGETPSHHGRVRTGSLPTVLMQNHIEEDGVTNQSIHHRPLDSTPFSSSSSSSSLHKSPQEHPVLLFRKGILSTLPFPIPVLLWPYMDKAAAKNDQGMSADILHIELNGVEESAVLELAQDGIRTLDPHVVWVTDTKFRYAQWCTRLVEKARKVVQWRQQQELSLVWPIYVVDFTDPPQLPKRCRGLEEIVGPSHVLYFKRSIVVDRKWNFTQNWLELGHPLATTTTTTTVEFNVSFQQTPLIVRTDIVHGIATSAGNLSDLPRRHRPVDIAHYWPPSTEIAKFSNLRNQVSNTLVKEFPSHRYRVICDMIGQHDMVGRREAQQGYIQSMMETKIIVTAQRDTYEDHYRLYEALASGAMVLTDPMFTLPFDNGTHLIVYTSLPDMIQSIHHYLTHEEERIQIAEAGYAMAMHHHRSWHRMEEIILGRPITTCDQYGDAQQPHCPFTVHTNTWLQTNSKKTTA